MSIKRSVIRFLGSDSGATIVTEGITWATIVAISLGVGLASVRFALADFFRDEAERIAAVSNQFSFDTGSTFYCEVTTTNFNSAFPTLGIEVIGPTPAPAEAEGS